MNKRLTISNLVLILLLAGLSWFAYIDHQTIGEMNAIIEDQASIITKLQGGN